MKAFVFCHTRGLIHKHLVCVNRGVIDGFFISHADVGMFLKSVDTLTSTCLPKAKSSNKIECIHNSSQTINFTLNQIPACLFFTFLRQNVSRRTETHSWSASTTCRLGIELDSLTFSDLTALTAAVTQK